MRIQFHAFASIAILGLSAREGSARRPGAVVPPTAAATPRSEIKRRAARAARRPIKGYCLLAWILVAQHRREIDTARNSTGVVGETPRIDRRSIWEHACLKVLIFGLAVDPAAAGTT